MEYVVICIVALLGSGVTFISGFGLAIILIPVFGFFFSIEVAIMLAAIVQFLNNLFKLTLVYKNIDKKIMLRFGIPANLSSFAGAFLLTFLVGVPPLLRYSIGHKTFEVMLIKIIIGVLLIFFALFEIIPRLQQIHFDKKYLPLGGIVSGFFGGLSGNQGALKTAFLIKADLSKEVFIATMVAIACLVDTARLIVYSKDIIRHHNKLDWMLITAATLSAFIGAFVGSKIFKNVTIKVVQNIVAIMLFVFAILLMLGII